MQKSQNKIKETLSQSNNTDDIIGKVWAIDLKSFIGWFFKIDNIKLALAITSIALGFIYHQINHQSRIKNQLSDSFKQIGQLRDSHQKELANLRASHAKEIRTIEEHNHKSIENLRGRNLQLENKVDILKSESRLLREAIESCRFNCSKFESLKLKNKPKKIG